MEGFIMELSLDIGHLQEAIEDFERQEDLSEPFLACQYDRLVHVKNALIEVRDALKEYLADD